MGEIGDSDGLYTLRAIIVVVVVVGRAPYATQFSYRDPHNEHDVRQRQHTLNIHPSD